MAKKTTKAPEETIEATDALEEATTIEPEEAFRKFMDIQAIMGELRHRKMRSAGPGCDPTRGRGRILALLKLTEGGIATKGMAQIIGVRVSSLNETLAKLEKDGLIQRIPSDDDKRVMLVSLTEKGRKQAPQDNRLPNFVFDGFSSEELGEFSGYLDRMTANLEGALGEEAQEFLENMRQARKEFFEQHKGHGPREGRCGHDGHGPHGHHGPHGGHDFGPGHGPHGGHDFGPEPHCHHRRMHHMHHMHDCHRRWCR